MKKTVGSWNKDLPSHCIKQRKLWFTSNRISSVILLLKLIT